MQTILASTPGRAALLLSLALLASACGDYGGGGGGGSASTPTSGSGSGSTPTGGTSGPTDAELQAGFEATVYPILRQHCATCHAGAGPGTPHIAAPDPALAFRETWYKQKVDLNNPSRSRLVRRLVADSHFCWSNCASDGAVMQAAIEQWAALVNTAAPASTPSSATVSGLVSENLTLADGFEDEGQDRYSDNLIAFWDFKEGGGTIAHDTSGVAPALDLTLEGPTFLSSYGIRVESGRAIAPQATSKKLYDLLAEPSLGTQQYTVEAWIAPANTVQEGPARIVNYSGGTGGRNFGLGQVTYYYNFRNRTVNPEGTQNGDPALQTADADRDAQATLQHVVITYDPYRGRRVYVDGRWTEDEDALEPLPLWNWSPSYRLVMGNEVGNDRPWQGQIRLVAIYKYALTDAQVFQNWAAGVGKRVLMRFDVSRWAGAGSYIEFVVSELDDYSYLFCQPTFHSPSASNARVGKLRVLVNGQTPASGQAFVNVDTIVTSTAQELSPLCSVIQKDAGPIDDVFTVDLEYLASYQSPKDPPPVPPLPPRSYGAPLPSEGLRDFRRVNEAMAAITGVDPTTPAVKGTFDGLALQLPIEADLRTFAAAQQVAITKLSLEYCEALVETPALRDAFFDNILDFSAPPATAFASQTTRDALVQRLVDRVYGVDLASQPDFSDAGPVLDGLIDALTAGCTAATCDAERTQTVVKSLCAAALGSAATTIH